MAKWTKVPGIEKLENGTLVKAAIDGDELCIGMVDGKPFAVENVCSHQEYPLHDGKITEDGLLRCRYHGAKFNPFDGSPKAMPASYPLYTHPVEMRTDGIYVFI